MLATDNGGATWNVQSSPTGDDLFSVAFSDSKHGLAVGNGTILTTTDGGAHWRMHSAGNGNFLTSVAVQDKTHACAVGRHVGSDGVFAGLILRISDGGNTWVQQIVTRTAAYSDLFGVAFADLANGWAVGVDSTIYGTRDAGKHWTLDDAPGDHALLKAVTCTSAREVWAVGDGGVILHTTDGGARWMEARPAHAREAVLNSVAAVGGSVWVVGESGTILVSIDDGKTWKPSAVSSASRSVALESVNFRDASHGWVAGDGGTVLSYGNRIRIAQPPNSLIPAPSVVVLLLVIATAGVAVALVVLLSRHR